MRLGKKILAISVVTVVLCTMGILVNEQFLVEANNMNNEPDKVFEINKLQLQQLNFSTFFGGSDDEQYSDIADLGRCDITLDSQDNIIIVGRTESTDLPVVNAYQNTHNGGVHDAFVAKLSPNGNTILFCTYLGGSNAEWASCVATDINDNIIVGGTTSSSNFPTLDFYQETNLGGPYYGTDVFITKFNTSGQLEFSTFLGGTGDDWCYGIDADSSGRIAVTGSTYSTDFPMDDAYQDTHSGAGVDYFITMFESDDKSIRFSTFLGGNAHEGGASLAYDNSGNILVTGLTGSTDFPCHNAYDDTFNGGSYDITVAKFANNGNIIYATYLGGYGWDQPNKIIADSNNNAVFIGHTTSFDYPITTNAYQKSMQGSNDVCIGVLSYNGDNLSYASFFGGTGDEECLGLAADNLNRIVIAGYTSSKDLPLESAFQTSFGGGSSDGFIARFDNNYKLNYSTYLGGINQDDGQRVAVTQDGNIVAYGYTKSGNFPTIDAYQSNLSGSSDVFITKFNLDLYVAPVPTVVNGFTLINPLGVIFLVGALFTFIKRRHRNK